MLRHCALSGAIQRHILFYHSGERKLSSPTSEDGPQSLYSVIALRHDDFLNNLFGRYLEYGLPSSKYIAE